MKKKKISAPKEVLKLNLITTILILFVDLFIFFGIDSSKDKFTNYSTLACAIIFFLYVYLLHSLIKKDTLKIKEEASLINYPLRLTIFFIILLMIIILSTISLISVNPEAANITFVFTFFMSTISMLFPSILLIVFMFFVIPAIIIPSIGNKNRIDNSLILIFIFLCVSILGIFIGVNSINKSRDISKLNKFESSKITIAYSSDYLKFSNEINSYTRKKMTINSVEVPFDYLKNSISIPDYESAKKFCEVINTKLPNYLETYYIVFNKFDTFGEKYYWTEHKDGQHDLVLHYKNMSYTIERRPQHIIPKLYCVARDGDKSSFQEQKYFYKIPKYEQEINLNQDIGVTFNAEPIKKEIPEINNIAKEKRFVSFSIKEVPSMIFKQLLDKGYYYNPQESINSKFEKNEIEISYINEQSINNIRLCHFPFTEYGDLGINQELQIWEQSFCSPSFKLINQTPVLKMKNGKDSYCYAYGGRLPNIPELNGILKTLGTNNVNEKYWTNNRISDAITNEKMPVLVYYKNSKIMQVKALNNNEDENANVFCITKPEEYSSVIANYKSRFANKNGNIYAKEKCPNCHYYEVPDVILKQ